MKFSAKAHTRDRHKYSNFHQSLLHENSSENYGLRHIYSLENTKQLLKKWGWTEEEIKTGIEHITIDVYEKIVYIHIPAFIIKRGEKIKIRGISRFVSKADYVNILVMRCWSKADPYKLEVGDNWDEFIVKGNTGEFYSLSLLPYSVTCTCNAYRGIEKAFEQDYIASKHLLNHHIAQGQIPDKHIFAVWKYLGADNQAQYEYVYCDRRDKATGNQWEFMPDPEYEYC